LLTANELLDPVVELSPPSPYHAPNSRLARSRDAPGQLHRCVPPTRRPPEQLASRAGMWRMRPTSSRKILAV
jgi:hypothetical protein